MDPATWSLGCGHLKIKADVDGRGRTVHPGTEKPGVGGSIPPLGTNF